MFKNKLNHTLLLLHLFMLNSLLFPYSSFAADQTVQVCVSPNSIEDQDREMNLVYQINRAKLDLDRAINELNRLSSEIEKYSTKIDKTAEIAGELAMMDTNAVGIVNALANHFIEIPGVEVDIEEKYLTTFSLSKALLDLSNVLEAFTPSNLADWITGTSLAIGETKVKISSDIAQATLNLSKYLREVRQRCEQVNKKEQERLAKKLSNTQEVKIPIEPDKDIANDVIKNTLRDIEPDKDIVNDVIKNTVQDFAAIPDSKKEPAPNTLNFRAFGTFGLIDTNKEKLLARRGKGLSNLIGIPACSFISGPKIMDGFSSPVWYIDMYYLGTPLSIAQAFNGYLTEVKKIHEDYIQVQYTATFKTGDENLRGGLITDWLKDAQNRGRWENPQHLKYAFNETVRNYPEPIDRSTIQCNF